MDLNGDGYPDLLVAELLGCPLLRCLKSMVVPSFALLRVFMRGVRARGLWVGGISPPLRTLVTGVFMKELYGPECIQLCSTILDLVWEFLRVWGIVGGPVGSYCLGSIY